MSDKILCPSCQTVKEREATCFSCHTPGETARIASLSKPRIVAECVTCDNRPLAVTHPDSTHITGPIAGAPASQRWKLIYRGELQGRFATLRETRARLIEIDRARCPNIYGPQKGDSK